MFPTPESLVGAITDNASVALFIMDGRQHCVFMNPAAVELTGYRLEEVAGRPLHDFVHYLRPDGSPYPLAECPIDRAFPERNRMQGEEVFVHKDGHFYPVAFTASPIRNRNGETVGTIIEVQDITERREQEVREARSVQLLTNLVERAPFGMYIVDADFRITLMNEGSKRVAFRNVPDVIGKDFGDAIRVLWPEPVASEIAGRFRHTLETGESYHSSDFRNPRRDVEAIEAYEWELQRITLPDGRFGVVCYYFDSTQVRDAEIALRDADRRKDEFLAVLAHELRNPLAPIRTAVALQRTRPIADPMLAKCRDVVDRQVALMSRLLDDLLDVSRLGRGKLVLHRERVPFGTVLDLALETSRPEVERHQCHLHVDTPPLHDVLVDGDSARLSQVFANLLNNAAKYNHRGGHITLAVHLDADRGQAVVTVSDTGRGIAPEFQPRLFELFAQAHPSPGVSATGLGIGLHLARQLVELHGGQISASSAGEDQGSSFVVRLPVVQGDVRELSTDAAVPASAGSTLRVLVAEDNADGAEMLTTFLREAGCRVDAVGDGTAALQKAAALRPDALVLDIGLPGMDGYAVCAAVRASEWGRSMRIVALTGWGQPEDRQRSAAAGFDDHLVKPIDPHRLLACLHERNDSSRR